jgi:REP-associated tyrosine transposase
MARPLRLEFPGAIWHVTSRGNEKKDIFRDSEDRALFLRLLARTVDRCRWWLHAFVLMSNHYHLLVETPEPSLSRGMHDLNGIYTQRFHRRHGRVGHFFQGRFKGILIEKESHLLEVARYVVLNPVRAGMVSHAEDWPWSNYCATAGLKVAPRWLQIDWTLSQFARERELATTLYRGFVEAGEKRSLRPWDGITAQIYLGSEEFRKRLRARIEGADIGTDIPRRQVRIGRPNTTWLLEAVARVVGPQHRRGPGAGRDRALIAYLAREDAGEGLAAIGAALAVTPSMACKLALRGERLLARNLGFRRQAEEVRRLWADSVVRRPKGSRFKV